MAAREFSTVGAATTDVVDAAVGATAGADGAVISGRVVVSRGADATLWPLASVLAPRAGDTGITGAGSCATVRLGADAGVATFGRGSGADFWSCGTPDDFPARG